MSIPPPWHGTRSMRQIVSSDDSGGRMVSLQNIPERKMTNSQARGIQQEYEQLKGQIRRVEEKNSVILHQIKQSMENMLLEEYYFEEDIVHSKPPPLTQRPISRHPSSSFHSTLQLHFDLFANTITYFFEHINKKASTLHHRIIFISQKLEFLASKSTRQRSAATQRALSLENANLRRQIYTLEQELLQKQNHLSQLEDQAKKLDHHVVRLQDQLNLQSNYNHIHYEKTFNQLTLELESVKQELKDLHFTNNDLMTQNQAYQVQLEKSAGEVKDLRQNSINLTKDLQNLHSSETKLKKQIEEKNSEISQLNSHLQQLNSQLKKANDLAQHFETLHHELKSKETKNEGLFAQKLAIEKNLVAQNQLAENLLRKYQEVALFIPRELLSPFHPLGNSLHSQNLSPRTSQRVGEDQKGTLIVDNSRAISKGEDPLSPIVQGITQGKNNVAHEETYRVIRTTMKDLSEFATELISLAERHIEGGGKEGDFRLAESLKGISDLISSQKAQIWKHEARELAQKKKFVGNAEGEDPSKRKLVRDLQIQLEKLTNSLVEAELKVAELAAQNDLLIAKNAAETTNFNDKLETMTSRELKLKKELSSAEARANSLKEAVAISDDQNKALLQEMNDLQIKSKQTESTLKNLHSKYSKAKQSSESVQADLKETISQKLKIISQLQTEKKNLEDSNKYKTEKVEKLQESIHALTTKVNTQISEIEVVRSQLEAKESQLELSKNQIEQLRSRIHKLLDSARNAQLHEQSKDALEKEVKRLTEGVNQLQSAAQIWKKHEQELREKLKIAEKKISEKGLEMNQLSKEHKMSLEKQAEMREELNRERERSKLQTEALNEAGREREELRGKICLLELTLAEMKTAQLEIKSLFAKKQEEEQEKKRLIKHLEEKLQKTSEIGRQLEVLHGNLNQEKKQLKMRLADEQATKEKALQNLDTLRTELNTLEKFRLESDIVREKLRESETENLHLMLVHAKQEQQVKTLKELLQKVQAEKDSFKNGLENSEKAKEKLEGLLREAEIRLADHPNVAGLKQEIEALKEQKTDLLEQIEETREAVELLKTECNRIQINNQVLEEKVRSKDEKVRELIRENTEQMTRSEKEMFQLKNEVNILKSALNAKEEVIKSHLPIINPIETDNTEEENTINLESPLKPPPLFKKDSFKRDQKRRLTFCQSVSIQIQKMHPSINGMIDIFGESETHQISANYIRKFKTQISNILATQEEFSPSFLAVHSKEAIYELSLLRIDFIELRRLKYDLMEELEFIDVYGFDYVEDLEPELQAALEDLESHQEYRNRQLKAVDEYKIKLSELERSNLELKKKCAQLEQIAEKMNVKINAYESLNTKYNNAILALESLRKLFWKVIETVFDRNSTVDDLSDCFDLYNSIFASQGSDTQPTSEYLAAFKRMREEPTKKKAKWF